MAIFRPFKAYRPKPEVAGEIAAKPYDVLNSDEAREEVKGHPLSFLHINTRGMVLPGNLSITSFGEVFRTDCPALNSTNYPANAWRMFTDSIEIGGLFNYYLSLIHI